MPVDAQPAILGFRCVKGMAGYDPVLDQQYLALGGWNCDQATKCGSGAFIQNFCPFFSNSGRRQFQPRHTSRLHVPLKARKQIGSKSRGAARKVPQVAAQFGSGPATLLEKQW